MEKPTAAPNPETTGASSDKYGNLGADAAASLIAANFLDQLPAADDDATQPLGDEEPERWIGDRAAVIATEDGSRSVAVSSLPLGATDNTGRLQPVDLTLRHAADAFRPENPVLDGTTFPDRLSEGVGAGNGVTVTFAGASGADPAARQIASDTLVYANVTAGTDVAVQPLRDGIEAAYVLRSPSSDATPSFTIDAGAGTSAVVDVAGNVVVSRGGTNRAIVRAPSVVDAAGNTVPAAYRVSGTTVTIDVDVSAAKSLPLLVDPVIQTYGADAAPANQGGAGWHGPWWAVSSPADYFPFSTSGNSLGSWGPGGRGLYIFAYPTNAYAAGHFGEWTWQAPGATTYITEVAFGPMYTDAHGDATNDAQIWTGIYKPGASWFAALDVKTLSQANAQTTSVGSHLGDTSGFHGADIAVFGLVFPTTRNHPQWTSAYLGGTTMYLDDPEAPTVAPLQHTSNPPALPVSAFNDQVTVTASDPGVGIKSITLRGLNTGDTTWTSPCEGNLTSVCPPSASHTFAISTSQLDVGANDLSVTATDALGHESEPQVFTVERVAATPDCQVTSCAAAADVCTSPPSGMANSHNPTGLVQYGDALVAGHGNLETAISTNPEEGAAIERGGSRICIKPVASSSGSGSASLTTDEQAAVFTGTAVQTDTIIKPTLDGIETFNNIKGASAPESFSWTIDLAGNQQLVPQPDGSVQIIDPTPTAGELGLAATDVSPSVVSPIDPADPAGSQPPSEGAVTSAPGPASSYPILSAITDPLTNGDLVTPPSSFETAPPELADQLATGVTAIAESSSPAPGGAPRSPQDIKDHNAELAASTTQVPQQPVVVATIQAPTSMDAEGRSVPTTMTVSGSTITVAVDHQGAGFSYPISADPIISFDPLNRTVSRCCIKVATAYVGVTWGSRAIRELPSYFFGFDNFSNRLWAVNFWGTWALVYDYERSPVLMGAHADVNNPPSWAIIVNMQWTTAFKWETDCTELGPDKLAQLCADVTCWTAFADNPDGVAEFCNFPIGGHAAAANAGGGYGASPEEGRFCVSHPYWCTQFQKDANKAVKLSERLFTGTVANGQADSTRANAFMHSFWLSLMANSRTSDGKDPGLAKTFGLLHEKKLYEASPVGNHLAAVNSRRSRMDLINNETGWRWADGHRGHNDEYMCFHMMNLNRNGRYYSPDFDFLSWANAGYYTGTDIVWRQRYTRNGILVEPTGLDCGPA